MPKLGVNIDHVATVRQARREFEPDPLGAAMVCVQAGADSIVAHLREDRRHIQDKDIVLLRRKVKTRFNLEMSLHPEIVAFALKLKPHQATLVPERRQEITTEGGLDVAVHFKKVKQAVAQLSLAGIEVSLFIDPQMEQIKKSYAAGARMIELHTGAYAQAISKKAQTREWQRLNAAARFAKSLGFAVNAGHGLNYSNVRRVAEIPGIAELNIGHSIISRAVFTGLTEAVRKMLELISYR